MTDITAEGNRFHSQSCNYDKLKKFLSCARPSGHPFPASPHGISTKRSEPTTFLPADKACKDWWRDVADKKSMQEAFSRFIEPIEVLVDDAIYEKAWAKVEAKLRSCFPEPLEVLGVGDAAASLPQTTSAGFPFVKCGFSRKGEALPVAKNFVRRQWRTIAKGGSPLRFPVLGGARRVVRRKPKNKPRLVWVFPLTQSIVESQFSFPVLSRLKELKPNWFGTSLNWLDEGRTLSRFLPRRGLVYSLDFSSFDSRVASRFIRSAFGLIQRLFVLTETEKNMFEDMIDYFIHTPINMYGDVVFKHRGVPSGSNWTQLIDTLVNMFYAYYAECACEDEPISFTLSNSCCWLGDDSDLTFTYYPPEDEMDRLFFDVIAKLGPQLNVDKCERFFASSRQVAQILSRTITYCKPFIDFDHEKFIVQIYLPEDPDKEPGHVLARLQGLCWSYGFQKWAYDKLTACRDLLFSRYGEVTPVFKKSDNFRYLLGCDVPSVWPEFNDLRVRYLGYS